jgi:hypothetical protein
MVCDEVELLLIGCPAVFSLPLVAIELRIRVKDLRQIGL